MLNELNLLNLINILNMKSFEKIINAFSLQNMYNGRILIRRFENNSSRRTVVTFYVLYIIDYISMYALKTTET
jgi:hypothetical protein